MNSSRRDGSADQESDDDGLPCDTLSAESAGQLSAFARLGAALRALHACLYALREATGESERRILQDREQQQEATMLLLDKVRMHKSIQDEMQHLASRLLTEWSAVPWRTASLPDALREQTIAYLRQTQSGCRVTSAMLDDILAAQRSAAQSGQIAARADALIEYIENDLLETLLQTALDIGVKDYGLPARDAADDPEMTRDGASHIDELLAYLASSGRKH
jgi:chemotaxis regulatin CheY-phosphate phosphatase CheZ